MVFKLSSRRTMFSLLVLWLVYVKLWVPADLSPEKFLESNCLQRRKLFLHKIGEMERVHCEGQLMPLLSSHGSEQRGSCPSIVGRP